MFFLYADFAGNSGARDSRRSSRSRRSSYDAYPEVDPAKLRDSLAFKEIYNATGNFSLDNKIGEGGFGTVYKGTLKDGRVVAVKRAKSVRCAIKLRVGSIFVALSLSLTIDFLVNRKLMINACQQSSRTRS